MTQHNRPSRLERRECGRCAEVVASALRLQRNLSYTFLPRVAAPPPRVAESWLTEKHVHRLDGGWGQVGNTTFEPGCRKLLLPRTRDPTISAKTHVSNHCHQCTAVGATPLSPVLDPQQCEFCSPEEEGIRETWSCSNTFSSNSSISQIWRQAQ